MSLIWMLSEPSLTRTASACRAIAFTRTEEPSRWLNVTVFVITTPTSCLSSMETIARSTWKLSLKKPLISQRKLLQIESKVFKLWKIGYCEIFFLHIHDLGIKTIGVFQQPNLWKPPLPPTASCSNFRHCGLFIRHWKQSSTQCCLLLTWSQVGSYT